MKNIAKCPRCGKEEKVTFKTVRQEVECSHCHKKMTIAKKNVIELTVFKYLFVLLIALLLVTILQIMKVQSIITYLLCVLVLSFLLASISDKVCLKIVYLLFGVEYIEKKEEKHERKNRK